LIFMHQVHADLRGHQPDPAPGDLPPPREGHPSGRRSSPKAAGHGTAPTPGDHPDSCCGAPWRDGLAPSGDQAPAARSAPDARPRNHQETPARERNGLVKAFLARGAATGPALVYVGSLGFSGRKKIAATGPPWPSASAAKQIESREL